MTCVGYIRSVLAHLAGRRFPAPVRRFEERGLVVLALRRSFESHADALVEIGRYAREEPRLVGALVEAATAVARVARECGAEDRARAATAAGERIAAMAAEP